MTSNQVIRSTSKDSIVMQPGTQSDNLSIMQSVSIILNCENAFVNGALRDREGSSSFHIASQGSAKSISPELPFERSSLEILGLASSKAYISLPENRDAISTALPNSIDEEIQHSLQEPVVPDLESYASTIETLHLHLPHLNNIQNSSRYKNVNVTCYDYSDQELASVKEFSERQIDGGVCEVQTDEGVSLQQHLGGAPSENVRLRLIVANDLSTKLIQCLGSLFSISPEVYEEHLVNSGWQNGMYNDQEPVTWITRDMKKSHTSVKWYRPVKRTMQRLYSTRDRQRLLDSSALHFRWTEAVPSGFGKPNDSVEHDINPATNILRRDWKMQTDAEAKTLRGSFTMWEERATVWSKQCGGYRVDVLLLDPLPVVKDSMTGTADALKKLGVYQPELIQATTKHAAKKVITGSSATKQLSRGHVNSDTSDASRPNEDQNISRTSPDSLIAGPQDSSWDDGSSAEEPEVFHAAEDPESGQTASEHQQNITTIISRAKARSGVPKWLNRLLGRFRKRTDTLDRAEEPDFVEESEGTEMRTLKTRNRCMFKGLYPRGPAVDYDFLMDPENVDLLAEYLDHTKSTAANLAEWLTQDNSQQPLVVGPTTHLEYLFAIIQNDTVNTLCHMDLALRKIGKDILDDTLIQQRLVHWRLLLERFDSELQQLEDSLRRFAGFIYASGSPCKNNIEGPDQDRRTPSVEELLEDSVSQMNSLRQRTTRSHKSIMANMSIIESKRGIAEAESVTKLTELAFLFIPLTFSASIFSMQVKELNASRISITAFFILAIIVTAASYAIRLVIRSDNFISLKRKLLTNIRHDASLGFGSPIPTRSFIAWLWRRIRWVLIVVGIMGVVVGPSAALWTSQLTTGIKVGVTIVIGMLYVGPVVFLVLQKVLSRVFKARLGRKRKRTVIKRRA